MRSADSFDILDKTKKIIENKHLLLDHVMRTAEQQIKEENTSLQKIGNNFKTQKGADQTRQKKKEQGSGAATQNTAKMQDTLRNISNSVFFISFRQMHMQTCCQPNIKLESFQYTFAFHVFFRDWIIPSAVFSIFNRWNLDLGSRICFFPINPLQNLHFLFKNAAFIYEPCFLIYIVLVEVSGF